MGIGHPRGYRASINNVDRGVGSENSMKSTRGERVLVAIFEIKCTNRGSGYSKINMLLGGGCVTKISCWSTIEGGEVQYISSILIFAWFFQWRLLFVFR